MEIRMTQNFKILLPAGAAEIIRTLQKAGFEAYAVGGCVRDSLLGRQPDDWDITTSAKPEQVKALFARTADTGIQHGTVTVLINRTGYEVTTYRIDGKYEDGRHPKNVTFAGSLEEDLKRRDFTVNAMAYNDDEGLIDLFDGVGDMRRRMLRCVGNPGERFGEDALRMMRAVRFSAQLDYRMEEKTREAAHMLAKSLARISAERIAAELVKLLVSNHPERMRDCYEIGLTAVFFPEFDRMMETGQNNPHHLYSVGEHTIHAMEASKPDRVIRLSLLLHDAGKVLVKTRDGEGIDHFHGHAQKSAEIAKTVLRRLKFDNYTTDRVIRLVCAHDVWIAPDGKHMRRAMNRIGKDLFPDLFAVKEADIKAQSLYLRQEKEETLARLRQIYGQVERAGECVSLKELAVSGTDLIAAGIRPGKGMGQILQNLLEEVLEEPSRNEKSYLTQKAKELARAVGGNDFSNTL